MIRLNNLSKSFDSNLVINNLSFSFPSTGLFHIQGINGCGKSTLLRIIAGLDLDYDGDVIYNSQKITAKNAASKVSLGLSAKSRNEYRLSLPEASPLKELPIVPREAAYLGVPLSSFLINTTL